MSKHKTKKFGKYGLLSKTNLFSKYPEFLLWLKEEKNIENISKDEEKRYYSEFIDLYNNTLFKSKKFYDLTKYEAKENKQKLCNNTNVLYVNDSRTIFDDEGIKEKENKLKKTIEIQKRLKENLANSSLSDVEELKNKELKKKLMIHYYKIGQEDCAKDIHNKYYKKESNN